MIARELLVKLGFDIQVDKLNKFNDMVDNTKNKMASIKQGVIGNVVSPEVSSKFEELKAYQEELKGLSKHERAEILALNKLEKQSISEVSNLDKARNKEKLRQLKAERQLTEEAERREKLINAKRDLSSLSRKVAMIGASIAAGLGLSLRSTLKDVQNYKTQKATGEKKTNSVFTPSQISAADSFNKALESTKSIITDLRNSFVIDMLPAIKETLEVFNAWVQKNKEFIKSKLKALIEGLSTAFKILSSVIGRVIGILDMIVEKTVGWKFIITTLVTLAFGAWLVGVASSVMAVASAFKVLTAAIMTNPIVLAVTAVIVVLALLVDEIYTTIQGGDSLINDFLKSDAWAFYKLGVEKVIEALKDVWDWLVKVGKAMRDLPSTITTEVKGFFGLNDESKVKPKFKGNEENIKSLSDWSMPKYTANDLKESSSIVNNHNKTNSNVTQKNSFNMNITVPVGTSQEQAKHIGMLMKAEIEKYDAFKIEKTINAIGAH